VIEQITKQKLPEGFQTAEFFLDHGMIDLIVARPELRGMVVTLLGHYATAAARVRPAVADDRGDVVVAGLELGVVAPDGPLGTDVLIGTEAVGSPAGERGS
jgi:hypothetical protein